ncbi:MAG: hypothetical protein EA415_15715 [Sphaerobacteraceae bacterium]|nr:MAG: hypothetical protein EA415_15715 [Sphaerobacteraceae bacterium]
MNQRTYHQTQSRQSGGGCGRIAMIGGGCVAFVVVGFVVLIVAGSLFWDRGTEAGGNFVSSWLTDQFGTDISDRAASVDDFAEDLSEPQAFGDRESYLHFLEEYNREFAATMGRVADLVRRPQLQDDDWQDKLAREIAMVRHLEQEAGNATPPEEFETAHERWTTGMTEYRQAIDSTASALDSLSPSQLGEAVGSLSSATQSYIQMGEALDELGALEDLETIEKLRDLQHQQ